MTKFKQFIRTALIFLTGSMLSKLVSFFLLPLYTRKIDPGQFGNYDVAMSFINLIVPIAFFQIWDGMYRYSFEYKVKEEKEVVKDLGADSLDVVEMLMSLEEEFNVTVPEEEAVNIKTVGDIVNLIENK